MYCFYKPIDPRKPLDETDPPPSGWNSGETHDCAGAAIHSDPPGIFEYCQAWEKRELARYAQLVETS